MSTLNLNEEQNEELQKVMNEILTIMIESDAMDIELNSTLNIKDIKLNQTLTCKLEIL